MNTLNTQSLSEQVAQLIAKQIILGSLKSGERIQEIRITQELKVSRGSVREALLILQKHHLVDIFPRKGAMVATYTMQDIDGFFSTWFVLLRELITTVAAQVTPTQITKLTQAEQCFSTAHQENNRERFFNSAIHYLEVLYQQCSNRYLSALLKDLSPLSQRFLYTILRAQVDDIDQTYHLLMQIQAQIITQNAHQLDAQLTQLRLRYCQLVKQAYFELN